tara:strand:- start:463 stop:630 length:168 start_codon:yes stop_codon:yes gene_type:complete
MSEFEKIYNMITKVITIVKNMMKDTKDNKKKINELDVLVREHLLIKENQDENSSL